MLFEAAVHVCVSVCVSVFQCVSVNVSVCLCLLMWRPDSQHIQMAMSAFKD